MLGEMAVAALGVAPGAIESYGKAAIVGEAGELEHAAAILHPKLGKPLRAAVEKGAALVPSSKKMGGLGTVIDVPLGHKDAAYVRSHFDAMEVRVADAPRAGEIVVAIVVTDSGRPRPRVGGLHQASDRGQGRLALTAVLADHRDPWEKPQLNSGRNSNGCGRRKSGKGKLVIRNVGLLLSGDLERPILDADTVVAVDGLITAVGKAKDCDTDSADRVDRRQGHVPSRPA